jgi:type I restriction enzyme S subunit
MGHIKRHHLTDALTIVPPLPTLEAMSATMDLIVSKMVSQDLQARTLAAIRDALLPRLITGELRVPDAKQVIEGIE